MREPFMPFFIHITNSSVTFDHEFTSSTFIIDVHDSCEDFEGTH
jgi:hypothetical protein